MANPQREHGHIRIANSIWEAICHIRISGEARQVMDAIIRQTWGYGKKLDMITLDKFALMTGLRKADIIRAVKKLVQMNLISKNANGKYAFQKDFDRWKPLAKKQIVSKKANPHKQKSKSELAKKQISTDEPKDTIKDITDKDIKPVCKETTPLQKCVLAYKIKKGFQKDDKDWDKLNFKRCSRSAKQILDFFKDWRLVVGCIDEVGNELNAKALDWTLETICKRAAEWKLKGDKNNE